MIGARGSWRLALVVFAVASLGVAVGACGSTGKDAPRPTDVASGASLLGDEDGDSQGQNAYLDGDDGEVSDSGQRASAGVERAIAALVRRYYAAAAVEDGARACSLMYYIIAESIPEKYARPPGPLYLKGVDGCPALMTRVFKRFHAQLQAAPTVTAVRVSGGRADVLLGWKTLPAGFLEVRREGKVWKVGEPLAAPLP